MIKKYFITILLFILFFNEHIVILIYFYKHLIVNHSIEFINQSNNVYTNTKGGNWYGINKNLPKKIVDQSNEYLSLVIYD